MKTKRTAEINIETFEFPDMGVGRLDGERIWVKRGLPGQRVNVCLFKKKRKLCGSIAEILERSPHEVQAKCTNAFSCGGCTFQTLNYSDELSLKRDVVLKLITENGVNISFEPQISPAPNEYRYRNKMEFSFGDEYKNGPLNLGMRKIGSYYEVNDASCCNICPEDFNKITAVAVEYFREQGDSFYHISKHEGFLRHLTLRQGFNTGEILVNIVTVSGYNKPMDKLVESILCLKLGGKIAGILHTENDALADVVKPDSMKILYGRDYFYDMLGALRFKIYPFSFFQTNTLGALNLYNTVKEFAGDTEDKTIFDLYCGTGTIAQILSENAKKVYGVEIVESAVTAAIENAVDNNINNCEFIAGDVFKVVHDLNDKPDIIVLDPPREGINPRAIGNIVNFGADKIIYVSCKPTSLMRDLNVFTENGYEIENFRIHDMFPKSYHVECVVGLRKVEI
ncbi:MAG: 23S rRNA (uracil(1939)-C(5))-methyltransferase RlmD [Clostridiales bacterium]|jgi:23S rRNA (uracil-5-)-methyltransferase RumA|nr:23S rRNA (uracil(1939)-C(5))-methyltransferase RlmD [Clostridiales bacterium]